jgi:hypothetical protein
MPLPFSFPFYGKTWDYVYISSNGYVAFGFNATECDNTPLPSPGYPNNVLAAFWDDLDADLSDGVFYSWNQWTDKVILEYKNIQRRWGSLPFTFQIYLDRMGRIELRYLDMQGAVNSASVGIEDSLGMTGLQVAYNEGYLHDSLSVRIQDGCPWISGDPVHGTVSGPGIQEIQILVDVSDVTPGYYECDLVISSNDPYQPEVVIPVSLTADPTGTHEIELLPTAYALDGNYPNPFNPVTSISYDLPERTKVHLLVYNVSGALVRALVDGETQEPGHYRVIWDGRNDAGERVGSGVYLYKLRSDAFEASSKMIMIK